MQRRTDACKVQVRMAKMGWRVDMGACVGVCGRTVLYMGNEWVPLRTAVLVGQIDARDGRYGT